MGDLAKDINSSFPSKKVKALLNIIYTANWISSHQNDYFKPFGISPQQFNILKILKGANKPIKVQTIKERMIERSPNTTRLLDKLCDKGLAERFSCENDRRVVHINITEKGLILINEIANDTKLDLLANLNNSEAEQLSTLLDKIR